MEASFLQFFPTSADRASIHIVHRLEQRRVELNRMVRFRKREFRHGCVKLQLETLEENRMIDAPVRPAPAQDAIAQDEIHAFRLAIDATVERVKGLEDFHRRASGLFGFYPLVSRKLPTLQSRRPGRIVCELRHPRLRAILRFLQSLLESEAVRRVVPS